MEFREIDKSNYWDCMALTIGDNQEGFVADNKQSLVKDIGGSGYVVEKDKAILDEYLGNE